jgi:hypothetical protein
MTRNSIRSLKRRILAAMASTIVLTLKVPAGMTRYQAEQALRKMTRNSIRVAREGD